jgi:hypothetical protein
MVGTLLGLPDPPASEHAADALAVAICHACGSAMRDEIAVRRTSSDPRTPAAGQSPADRSPGGSLEAEDVPGIGATG